MWFLTLKYYAKEMLRILVQFCSPASPAPLSALCF